MPWSRRRQEGFALGALLCEDRAASAARRGLHPEVAPRAVELAEQLDRTQRADRRRFVRSMLQAGAGRRPIPAPAPTARSPSRVRALSLLAAELDPELGRALLAAAPPPRPGYVPPPALLRLLRRQLATDADASEKEP
jgi:hypothetical protein